ncbi:unnamed protein product [Sphagnum balticum]
MVFSIASGGRGGACAVGGEGVAGKEQDEEYVLLAHLRGHLQAEEGFRGGGQVFPECAADGAGQYPAGAGDRCAAGAD